MLDLLFVYGTLRSNFDNEYARLLSREAEILGPANVQGSIFLVGEYPGFRSAPVGTVAGELYRLRNPESTLAMLDSYEGEEYERVTTMASLHGEEHETWIYRFHRDPSPASRIASGDFCAR